MKGKEAEYVVPMRKIYSQPRTKRARKAVVEIRRFVLKHTRNPNVVITNDLNSAVWKHAGKVPRKLSVVLQEHGGKIYAYLKGSKQIEEDKKRREEAEKEKKKAAAKEAKKEPKGKPEEKAAEKELEEEAEEKRREKHEKELAAEKAAIKRKGA